MKHRFWIWGLFFACFMGFSCAKEVTQKVPFGTQMVVTMTMSEAPDPNAKYFLIFGNTSSISVPDVGRYLAGPGDGFDPNKVTGGEDYFARYFSTWSQYVLFTGNRFNIYKGPFSSGTVPPPILLAEGGISGKSLQLIFDIATYFSPVPSSFSFTFVTVGKDEALADKISSTELINNVSTESKANQDGEDTSSKPLDITEWTVSIR